MFQHHIKNASKNKWPLVGVWFSISKMTIQRYLKKIFNPPPSKTASPERGGNTKKKININRSARKNHDFSDLVIQGGPAAAKKS